MYIGIATDGIFGRPLIRAPTGTGFTGHPGGAFFGTSINLGAGGWDSTLYVKVRAAEAADIGDLL